MTRYALNNMLKYRIELVTEKNNLALLFLDLNKFKNVNDSFGHAIGDKVLCEAARRIKICLRSNDIVCRYGGDEFVIVLERINKDKAIEVARRIYKELQQPYKVDNYTIDFLSCSIGLAFAPTDTKDFKQLIEKADEAMYFAKKHSDANCIVIAQEIDKSRERKLSLELLNAFKRDEIYFKFHPILNLRQDKVIGCEVLSRWLNLHFDEVYPDVFIELVKKLSLEERFDTYVLENSILELREVILSNDILIFINLFPESFISESFFYKIQYILDQNYSLKGRLVLEITEESMINNLTLAAHFIQKYRKLGVKIAIDDFGKGFSSLNYLKNLDVDFIKIDRVFISNLNENNRDKAIVKAISSLAYALNSRVLAEGVETEAQLNILKSLDVEYVQGYYFAKPMGIKKLFDFLQNKHYQ